MAKLPTRDDMGPMPSARSGRGMATADQTAYGKGMEAVGRGLDQVGDMLHKVSQDPNEEFDAERRFQEFKFNEAKALEESTRQVQPGEAGGFAEKWAPGYQERAKEFFKTVPDRYKPKFDAKLFGAERDLYSSAAGFARHEQKRSSLAGLEEHRDRVATTGDLRSAVKSYDELLETNKWLTPIEKDEIRRKHLKDLKTRHIDWALLGGADPEQILADHGYVAGGKMPKDAPVAPRPDTELGSVSAKYESGGRGAGFVSTGAGDPGGPSYGVHQLSSKDSMPAFLRSEEGKAYAERFGKARPGSPEFNAAYKQIASEDPEGLAQAQKAFYTRTHYQPALDAAKKAGFDVEDRGIQEAIFSIGVQHGGAQKIIAAASGKGPVDEQIKSLYAARSRYVEGLTDLPPETKASVLNRYRGEVGDALALAGRKAQKGEPGGKGQLTGTPEDETGGPGPEPDDNTGAVSWGPMTLPGDPTKMPRNADMPLTHADVHKLRTALSHKHQERLRSEIARIEEGGDEEKDERGMTAFDRAKPILTQNVLNQWKTKRDKAILTRDATKPLPYMSEEEFTTHFASIGRDPATGKDRKDVEFAVIRDARAAAENAWERVQSERAKDPFAAASYHPEVVRAAEGLNRRIVGVGTESGEEETDPSLPVVVSADMSPTQQRIARREAVEANLAVQEKLGIFEPRHISRDGAKRLMAIRKDASPDEFRSGLVSAAKRAGDLYGPEMGEKVFKDALVLTNPTIGREKLDEYVSEGSSPLIAQKKAEARAELLAKQMFGRTITDADMQKLQYQDRWLQRIGEGPSFSARPALDPGRPAIGQQQRQPSEAHTKLLLQQMAADPVKARATFDAKFGEGAARRVMNRMIEGEMESP